MDIKLEQYENLLKNEKFTYSGLNTNQVIALKEKYGSNSFGEKKSRVRKKFCSTRAL